jgi:hypothetical protein
MELEKDNYIRADDNKRINTRFIVWLKKMDDCLSICTKTTGCQGGADTHKVCKINNVDTYKKLIKEFKY